MSPWTQRLMTVAWPAFLAASVLELLVFGMVDPNDMHWFGGTPPPLSRQGVYTLAFFAFWIISAAAGSLTALLAWPVSPPENRTD